MVDFSAIAMWAKLAVFPADRTKMVNAGLFILEGIHQVKEAVEIDYQGFHLQWKIVAHFQVRSSTYIDFFV